MNGNGIGTTQNAIKKRVNLTVVLVNSNFKLGSAMKFASDTDSSVMKKFQNNVDLLNDIFQEINKSQIQTKQIQTIGKSLEQYSTIIAHQLENDKKVNQTDVNSFLQKYKLE